jgi:purine-binding chemotaxis protein CheW
VGAEARTKAIYQGGVGRRPVSILAPEQLFSKDIMQRLQSTQAAQAQSKPESAGEELKFLVFRLGSDEFGLPIDAVVEVARVPEKITRAPKTAKFLEGVVNIRGDVLPVVDQRRRFDMPALEQTSNRRLIVVRAGRHRAGIIVDSVSQVLGASADAVKPAPDLTVTITRLLQGVIVLGDKRMVLLLDPEELLTRAEQGMLDAFESKSRATS